MQLLSTNSSQCSLNFSSDRFSSNFYLNDSILNPWKHSRSLYYIIISRIKHNQLHLFLIAFIPLQNRSTNYRQSGESLPPMRITYSSVNLKGEDQKLIPPGDIPKMNPKSIWIIFPSMSISILPLCLSLILRMYVIMEDPAKD